VNWIPRGPALNQVDIGWEVGVGAGIVEGVGSGAGRLGPVQPAERNMITNRKANILFILKNSHFNETVLHER